jgi:hypothetical protein
MPTPGPGTTQSSPPGGTGEVEGDGLRYGDERLAWFSSWFKDKPTIEDSVYHVLTWKNHGSQSCFLGDANSLLLAADFFTEAVDYIRNSFSTLTHFTIYGRTKSAARKSLGELKALCAAGLIRIHFGIESGIDSASNLLDVSGRLPHDRSRMLRVIDDYLGLSAREKLIFSLLSRLQSFIGQYGGASEDIVEAVRPYLQDGATDQSKASSEELK